MPTWVIVWLQSKEGGSEGKGEIKWFLNILKCQKKGRERTMASFWIWTAAYFKSSHFGHCPADDVEEEMLSAWGNSEGILRKSPVVSYGASLSGGTWPKFSSCPKPLETEMRCTHWERRCTIWENQGNHWNPTEKLFPPGRIAFSSGLPRSHLGSLFA